MVYGLKYQDVVGREVSDQVKNDQEILRVLDDVLTRRGYDTYEVLSITHFEEKDLCSVIVSVGGSELGMEINTKDGNIINSEKIAR